MTRFAGLKDDFAGSPASHAESDRAIASRFSECARNRRQAPTGSRGGKRVSLATLAPELSRALNILAIEESTTVQALMGEAFDLLMRRSRQASVWREIGC